MGQPRRDWYSLWNTNLNICVVSLETYSKGFRVDSRYLSFRSRLGDRTYFSTMPPHRETFQNESGALKLGVETSSSLHYLQHSNLLKPPYYPTSWIIHIMVLSSLTSNTMYTHPNACTHPHKHTHTQIHTHTHSTNSHQYNDFSFPLLR